MKYLDYMNMGEYSISPVQCLRESKEGFQIRLQSMTIIGDWKDGVKNIVYQAIMPRSIEFLKAHHDFPEGCNGGYDIEEISINITKENCPYCLIKIQPFNSLPFLAALYFDGNAFHFYIPKKGNMIYIPNNSLINEELSFPVSFEFSDEKNRTIRSISFFDMDEVKALCNYADVKLNYTTAMNEVENVLA